MIDDGALKAKVLTEVRINDLPEESLQIDVTNGIVTINGTVDTPELIEQIQQACNRVDGIVQISNNLSVS